jgi:signal transduction histidine kinase
MATYVLTSNGRAADALGEAARQLGLTLWSQGSTTDPDLAFLDLPWPDIQEVLRDGVHARMRIVVADDADLAAALEHPDVDEVLRVDAPAPVTRARLRRVLRAMAQSEARSRTLRLLAHDVNNPLTAIRLLAEMLAGDLGNDENRQDLQDILEASDLAGALMDTLSGVARLEGERVRGSATSVDLGALCLEVGKRPSMRSVVTVPDDPPVVMVLCDKGLLKQVVVDLFVNARRLGESVESGVTVTLSSTLQQGILRIAIADMELAPGHIDALTRPYGTPALRDARLQVAPSGLAFAARVASAHGGNLTIGTHDGELEFRLTLPRAH